MPLSMIALAMLLIVPFARGPRSTHVELAPDALGAV